MKEYWWIFVLAGLCAVFSEQIDSALAKLIAGDKKRGAVYCAACVILLTIIGVLTYRACGAISVLAGGWSVVFALAPVSVFIIAAGAGVLAARKRNKR